MPYSAANNSRCFPFRTVILHGIFLGGCLLSTPSTSPWFVDYFPSSTLQKILGARRAIEMVRRRELSSNANDTSCLA